jgi:hypothetical protein
VVATVHLNGLETVYVHLNEYADDGDGNGVLSRGRACVHTCGSAMCNIQHLINGMS